MKIVIALVLLGTENGFGQAVWQNSTTNTGFSTTASASKPDNTNSGDLLVASLTFRLDVSGVSVNPPEGWELILSTNQGSNLGLATYYKTATNSEPSSYSWAVYSSNNRWSLGISRISGASAVAPITIFDGNSSGSSSNSVIAPSIITSENNQLVLSFFANGNAGSFSEPSGSTERYDNPYTAGSSGIRSSNMLSTYIQNIAGSTGNRTATSSSSSVWAAQQIAINTITPELPSFPVIEDVVTYQNGSDTDSHNVTLPSGIQSGDLLLMILRPQSSRTINIPQGWTQLSSRSSSGVSYVLYKTADGNESRTQNITLNDDARFAAITYRISNWESNPEAEATSSNLNNPPSLITSWETSPTLFIAALTNRRSDSSVTGAPNTFSSLVSVANSSSSNTSRVRASSAVKFENTKSIDPLAFTTSGNIDNPHSFTIAIKG